MAFGDVRRKVIGVPLEKSMVGDDGVLIVRGKFTSDNRDEVGDTITRHATEKALPAYRRWGNVRLMHQPIPVGRVVAIGTDDGLGWNEVDIRVIDPQARFMVEEGLLQALSVGILVGPDDIDVLEDGGWVINGYQLAEISLVDHPANYDAELQQLNLSLDDSVREQMRDQGVFPVLRSLGAVPARKGDLMAENIAEEKDIVEEPETVMPEEPVAEVVEEKDLAAEDAVVEDSVIVEAVAEEVTAVEDAPVAEVADEAVAAVEDLVEEVPAENPLAVAIAQLAELVAGLSEQVTKLVAQKEIAPEADVEDPIEEVKDVSGADDRVAQLEKQLEEMAERLSTLTTPVDRKGAMPVEEAVEEEPVEKAVEIERPQDLRTAVSLFLASKQRR